MAYCRWAEESSRVESVFRCVLRQLASVLATFAEKRLPLIAGKDGQ